jgi:acyl-CoA synthetase (AMP-forming)/AMP-acid ligase II
LYRILDDTVRDFPKNEAVIFQGRGITYRELGEEVAHAASGLAQRGLKKGQRMTIMLPGLGKSGASGCPGRTPTLRINSPDSRGWEEIFPKRFCISL